MERGSQTNEGAHGAIQLPPVLPFLQAQQGLPQYQAQTLDAIREFYKYTIGRGQNNTTFGWPLLTRYMEGVNPGLYLIAGAPNLGKTAFMTHMAWNIAHQNKEFFCIYVTLDDNTKKVYPRFAAIASRLPMNVFSMPMRFLAGNPRYYEAYMRGMQALASSIDKMTVLDQSHGLEIEVIEETVYRYRDLLAGTGRVPALFVDNFHDLETFDRTKMREKNDRYEFIATRLKALAVTANIPIFATTEVKKIGLRRPTQDDIRETGNIVYEADVIFGIYNEVSLKNEAAQIYFLTEEDGPKRPVLEVDVLKNKLSSYKGRLFYHFVPELSYLQEGDIERQRYYESRLHS